MLVEGMHWAERTKQYGLIHVRRVKGEGYVGRDKRIEETPLRRSWGLGVYGPMIWERMVIYELFVSHGVGVARDELMGTPAEYNIIYGDMTALGNGQKGVRGGVAYQATKRLLPWMGGFRRLCVLWICLPHIVRGSGIFMTIEVVEGVGQR